MEDPENRESKVFWTDNSPVDYRYTHLSLNNRYGEEKCVRYFYEGSRRRGGTWYWADVGCDNTRHYVCKKGKFCRIKLNLVVARIKRRIKGVFS